jgi:hypothetical protein
MIRHLAVATVAAMLAVLDSAPAAQAPASPAPYTVLSRRSGRRPLAARLINGQEMFALDDLARLFNLSVKEDAHRRRPDRHGPRADHPPHPRPEPRLGRRAA